MSRSVATILRWIRVLLPTQAGDLTVSPADGKARIYRSGNVYVLEDQGNKGAASGYVPLNVSSLVDYGYLGTGGAGLGMKFLADDGTWKAGGGGGGTLDHAALSSNLGWTTSGHTGTASRLAGFDAATGAAIYYTGSTALDLVASTRGMIPTRGAATWGGLTVGASTYFLGSDGTDPLWRSPADARTDLGLVIGTNVQAYDADLTGLGGLGDGMPVRVAGTWGIATYSTGLSLFAGEVTLAAFVGDTGSGGAIGAVPAPAAGDGAAGKILHASGTWATPSSGLRLFYLTSTASDIATYKKALTSPSVNAETTLVLAATGTGDTLLASYATEPGSPGTTLLPSGTGIRHLFVATGASNQIGRCKVEIYTCTSSGASETLRRTGYTQSFSGTTIVDVMSSLTDASGYTMTTTDRLVIKVYGARVSGPATCNITVYLEGSNHTSYIESTISETFVDAGLISLTSADGAACIPCVTSANTWAALAYSGLSYAAGTLSALYGTTGSTACAGNDSRLSDSRPPTGSASGDLGGTYPSPTVTQARGLRETAGPTTLTMGAVADGQVLKRVGSTIIGVNLIMAIAMNDLGSQENVLDIGDSFIAPSGTVLSNGEDIALDIGVSGLMPQTIIETDGSDV